MLDYNRKDKIPSETISDIQKIIQGLNLLVDESSIKGTSKGDGVYSVRVFLHDFPSIGANGKGISYEYAMASAYAELMERIQSGFLLNYFIRKQTQIILFKDSEYLSNRDDLFLLNEHLRDIETIYSSRNAVAVVPYKCYENGRIEKNTYFSRETLFRHCGSNGLAAGNTYEEAFVQGFLENIERHSVKKIFERNITIRNINIDSLSEDPLYAFIKKLEMYNLELQVLDLTDDGSLPVLGVIVYDKSHTRYLWSVGSDFDFSIALQRCITEVFQGLDIGKSLMLKMQSMYSTVENSLCICLPSDTDVYTNTISFVINHRSKLPISLTEINPDTGAYKSAFYEPHSFSNQEAVDYCINISRRYRWRVYVRNCSFLNFPAVHVYIPSVSEIFKTKNESYSREKCLTEIIGNIKLLNNGRKLSDTMRRRWLYAVKMIYCTAANQCNLFVEYYRTLFNTDPPFYMRKRNDIAVLAFYCFQMGELELAYSLYEQYYRFQVRIEHISKSTDLEILRFLFLRKSGSVTSKLFTSNVDDSFDEVFLMFSEKCSIILPTCPDCECCTYRNNCQFDKYNELFGRIHDIAKNYIPS